MIQNVYFFIGLVLVFGWFMVVKTWKWETKNEMFHNHMWWFFMLTILFTSCYCNTDLNDYDPVVNHKSRSVEYYWYYNPTLFIGEDSVQVVGFLSNYDDTIEYSVNRRVKVHNDTIYIQKRCSSFSFNIFKGNLYFKNKDPYHIDTILLK